MTMEELSVLEFIKILKKYTKLIIFFIVTGTLILTEVTFFLVTPQYNSSTQVLINRPNGGEEAMSITEETSAELISTYIDIVKSPVILDVVREELNLQISNNELLNKINISNQTNSQVILLEVVDESPEAAATIANTITEVFRENVQDLIDVNRFTVISEAEPNYAPISPNKPLSIIMGAFIGLGSGVALALLLNFMDRTVKDDKFITEKLGWTPLGHVESVSEKKDATFEIVDLSEELPETSSVRSEI